MIMTTEYWLTATKIIHKSSWEHYVDSQMKQLTGDISIYGIIYTTYFLHVKCRRVVANAFWFTPWMLKEWASISYRTLKKTVSPTASSVHIRPFLMILLHHIFISSTPHRTTFQESALMTTSRFRIYHWLVHVFYLFTNVNNTVDAINTVCPH